MKQIAKLSLLFLAAMLQAIFGSSLDADSNLSHRKSSILGLPFEGISAQQRRSFDEGFKFFVRIWGEEDGLGPYYNARSCASCHAEPVISGSGTTDATFVFHSVGDLDQEERVFQKFEVGSQGETIERNPPRGFVRRKAPALFGLGLLEAVSAEALLEYADAADLNGDGISGRLARVSGAYGRFGWTGRTWNIEEAVASAFISEFGIEDSDMTSTRGGVRIERVEKVALNSISKYIRLLGPPPSAHPMSTTESRGKEIFMSIGCESCHRGKLKTKESHIEVLSKKTFHAYTDLLLHDMGPGDVPLATEGSATDREIRTPALWGLGSTGPPYMHDGRSADISEAIKAHDGEGRAAAREFSNLAVDEQEALIYFLKSL